MSASSENPISNRAVLLLSGGLDSVAALCWAQQRYVDLQAVSFDYGQPNRDAELAAAQRSSEARGVPWRAIGLSDAMRPERPAGILGTVYDHDASGRGGVDRAFVPGRNLVFATVAFAHACTWWGTGNIDVVIGACADDQAGFPDCRPTALAQLAAALRVGCGRSVAIRAPWATMTKAQILYAVRPDAEALDLVRRSYSCYRSDGPCRRCSACVKRAAAFADQGIDDLSSRVVMHGGDPARAHR